MSTIRILDGHVAEGFTWFLEDNDKLDDLRIYVTIEGLSELTHSMLLRLEVVIHKDQSVEVRFITLEGIAIYTMKMHERDEETRESVRRLLRVLGYKRAKHWEWSLNRSEYPTRENYNQSWDWESSLNN